MLNRTRCIVLGLLAAALAGGLLPFAATHAQGATFPLTKLPYPYSAAWPWATVQPVDTVAATATITPALTDTATPLATATITVTTTATPTPLPTTTLTPTATLSPTETPSPLPPTDTATPPATATPSPLPTSPPQPLPLFPSTPTRPVIPTPAPARPTMTPTPRPHHSPHRRRATKSHHRHSQRHRSHHIVLNQLRLWARPPVVGVHGVVTVGVQANTGRARLYMVARYGTGPGQVQHGVAPPRGPALLRLRVPAVAPCAGRIMARVYVTVASGPRAMTGAVTFLVQCPRSAATTGQGGPRARRR